MRPWKVNEPMSAGLNRLSIIGNVGGDAVVRYTQSGVAVASFTVAVTKRFKNQDGSTVERTTWVKCSAWRQLAENVVGPYVKKGDKIFVEGEASVSAYANNEGEPAASLELTINNLVLLGSKREGAPVGHGDSDDVSDIPF